MDYESEAEIWDSFVDSATCAEFKHADLKRVIKANDEGEALDREEADELITDHCSLRYRYSWLFICGKAINHILKPKEDLLKSIKDIKRAIGLLKFAASHMERINREIENAEKEGSVEEGDEACD